MLLQAIILSGALNTSTAGGVFRNKDMFKDPDVYDPERFIEHPDHAKVTDLIFGTGRVSLSTILLSQRGAHDMMVCTSVPALEFTSRRMLLYVDIVLMSLCWSLLPPVEAINVMNLMWGFDLKKPLDEHGNAIEPNISDYVQVCLFTVSLYSY